MHGRSLKANRPRQSYQDVEDGNKTVLTGQSYSANYYTSYGIRV